MRKRELIEILLPLIGIVLIFAALLIAPVNETVPRQVVVVLAGVLLLEASVWNLASPFLPEDRRYHSLRQEVDHFIEEVRELNRYESEGSTADGEGADARREEILISMHERVDRIGRLAGVPDDAPAAEESLGDAPS